MWIVSGFNTLSVAGKTNFIEFSNFTPVCKRYQEDQPTRIWE